MRVPLTLESSIGELMAHPVAAPIIMQAMASDAAVTAGLMAEPGDVQDDGVVPDRPARRRSRACR